MYELNNFYLNILIIIRDACIIQQLSARLSLHYKNVDIIKKLFSIN